MRVLLLPEWGENPYQQLLAEALRRRDVRVESAPWQGLFAPLAIQRRGVHVVHLHAPGRYTRTRSAWRAAARAARAAASLATLRALGVRVVWTAHDLEDHDRVHPRLDRALTRTVARLATAIVSHGEHARALVIERHRVRDPRRVVVIPHGPFDLYARDGIDGKRVRQELGLPEDAFVLLFLGALRPYKGVVELIEAFGESGLADRGAHLVVRGPVRDARFEKRLVRAAADRPAVHLDTGFVPDDQLAGFFAAADVAVAPYRAVLTSGSAVLAMSLGRPCIAPRLGGLTDQIDDDCGLLYDPDETGALAAALQRAFDQRAALPAMGARAREHVSRVSWDEIADRTAQVYDR